MSYGILPNGKQQFIDSNGNPLAGGKVYYYIPSTTTFKNTYQDDAGSSLNTNPVVLDASGQCIAYGTGSYRQQVFDVNGNLIWDQQVDTPMTSSSTFSSDLVTYNEGGTGAVATTVQAKLRQTVNVDDFGATGDGTTDDTTAIQNAVNAGSVIYFTGGKTYIVSPQSLTNPDGGYGICINVASNKTLMMYGATIKQKNGTSGVGGVISNTAAVSNVSIYGGTVDGNEANTTANMNGILLLNATNCRIQDVHALNTRFIGIGIRNPGSPAVAYGLNTIQGNYISNCLYIGIQCLRPILGVKILNNTIYFTGDNAIDIEANNTGAGVGGDGDQIIITGNSTFSTLNGIFLESVGNAIVSDNTIKNFTSNGIYLNRINSGSGYNIISNNKISDSSGHGIYVNNTSGYSLIEGNLFKTLAYSIYCSAAATNLSIGKNLHTNIGACLVGIPQDTNQLVFTKMEGQDVIGTRSSGIPFTCSPLSNTNNSPNRAFTVSISPAYILGAGSASATLVAEYQDGNTGTLISNPAWSGAYSVYTGGDTLVAPTISMNVGYYVTINGTLFLVYSSPSGGVFAIRSATGVAGNYTATTNGAYTWVEYWPQWQTT
jgi:parallel beta-helix repeat protein